jgi:hypothetical protein
MFQQCLRALVYLDRLEAVGVILAQGPERKLVGS